MSDRLPMWLELRIDHGQDYRNSFLIGFEVARSKHPPADYNPEFFLRFFGIVTRPENSFPHNSFQAIV